MADALKDMFDRNWVGELAEAVVVEHPPFDADAFTRLVFDDAWGDRELKQRMRHIAVSLHATLPADYDEAIAILVPVATAMGPAGFKGITFCDFVETFGLDHWDTSMRALQHFTRLSSAEYAIRPFLSADVARGMEQMSAWARSDNEHDRRLASEGSRPRLPWGMSLPALKADPAPILPLLDLLCDDPSDYVRRSVANNLNDIAKDNPDVVIEVVERWLSDPTPHRLAIARHGLRTLVKAGHPGALALLGFGAASVGSTSFTLSTTEVPFGGEFEFSVAIASTDVQPQRLVVDYLIEFARQGGKVGRKVFKLTNLTLDAGERTTLTRRYSFRPISTRRYYPGEHAIEIQVNGSTVARAPFILEPPR